jgi:hypothetical protein
MSQPSDGRELERSPGPAETPASIAQVDIGREVRCQTVDDDEPMGGDPPCWAHLFEDDELEDAEAPAGRSPPRAAHLEP